MEDFDLRLDNLVCATWVINCCHRFSRVTGLEHIGVLVKTIGKLDLTCGLFFFIREEFQGCFIFIYGELVIQCNIWFCLLKE